jgi:membrane-associated protease RseP (regulator of RpoE activity)
MLGESATVAETIEPTTNPAGLAVVAGLVLAIGFLYSWGAFIFVAGLIVCILLHELGHYLAAKRAGMKVTQFFLFFGPRLWSFRRGETEYGIRAIPLGAFVKVPGMHNMDTDVEPADEHRTYRRAPFHSRFLMAAAGSCMHFAIALVLILVTVAFIGRPKDPQAWQVRETAPDSPAALAGLTAGDRIVAIDGVPYERFDKVSSYLRSHPDTAVTLDVLRGDQVLKVPVTIAATGQVCQPGRLGVYVGPGDQQVTRSSVVSAVPDAFVEFGRTVGVSIQALGQIFSPSGLSQYSKAIQTGCNTDQRMLGPIGAAKAGAGICSDAEGCLALLISANIFIGIVNWFPMLPFDGGHMVVAAYERVRSRRNRRYTADVSKLLPLTYALVAVMLLLFVGNTYLDLRS